MGAKHEAWFLGIKFASIVSEDRSSFSLANTAFPLNSTFHPIYQRASKANGVRSDIGSMQSFSAPGLVTTSKYPRKSLFDAVFLTITLFTSISLKPLMARITRIKSTTARMHRPWFTEKAVSCLSTWRCSCFGLIVRQCAPSLAHCESALSIKRRDNSHCPAKVYPRLMTCSHWVGALSTRRMIQNFGPTRSKTTMPCFDFAHEWTLIQEPNSYGCPTKFLSTL